MHMGAGGLARAAGVWLALAGAVWAGGRPSVAQTAVDGAIGGRVTDATGGAVGAARVVVESADTGSSRVTASEADGNFLVTRVVPGRYRVTVSAAGFQTVAVPVTVELGGIASANARLSIAAVVTLVDVDAAPVGLASGAIVEAVEPSVADGAEPEAVIANDLIEALPVDGRRWEAFALLLPGSSGGTARDGTAISFRGVATTQNSSEIDGVSSDQSFGGVSVGTGGGAGREAETEADSGGENGAGGVGSRAMYGRHAGASYTFAQGAVEEFRVRSGVYSALDGRAAGGVVTTVSKSGTSSVRGGVFYQARDSAWAATDPFALATHYADGVVTGGLVKPRDLRQQFGGTVGGPVRFRRRRTASGSRVNRGNPDRVFYFAAVDVQRRSDPAVTSPGYASFYQLTATQQALLGNRGVTAKKTESALNYLDSLTGTVARREDQGIAFGKLDWQATAKNRLSFQANRVRWDSPAGVRSEPVIERGAASLGNAFGKVDAGVVRWVGLWTSHLSNELRVAYGRDFEYETAQPPLPQELAIGPGGLAPEVSIGPDGFTFGTPASLGRTAYPDERRFQAAEMVEWVHGKHVIQVGVDFSRVRDRIDALNNQEGTFRYDSGITGGKAGGLVDWITDYTFGANDYPNGGCPSINAKVHLFCFRTFTQSYGEETTKFRTDEWTGFVQEEWRAAARLHVSAGVRYEFERQPRPQQPNPALDAIFDPALNASAQGTSSGGVTGEGGTMGFTRGGSTSFFPEDKNNFGPRVGIAVQPFGAGRGMVRVGYGVYFGRLPGATIRSALVDTALPTSATHIRITPATVTGCPQVANQGFGYGCDYVAAPPAGVAATTSATVFDRRFKLPMVQHGSFGLERELGHGISASAAYEMSLERELPNSVDINIAPSTVLREFQLQGGPVKGTEPVGVANGETFVVPFYSARVSPLFGPVTDIVSNGNGTYHALVVAGERRSRKGLAFRASWTWSKALDYGQNDSATPRTDGQFDPFTVGYDKGLSTLNFPHKVAASAVWEPELKTPRRGLREIANGWQVSPLVVVMSGRPYSYEIFGGDRLDGGHTSINGSGGADYLPTIGRNTLRLPESVHADLRIARSVRLSERLRLRAAAEVFNLPNHVNYTSTTTRAYQPGTAAAGITPLVFQDAATVATEGINELPFGAYTAASTSNSRERQVQLGVRLEF